MFSAAVYCRKAPKHHQNGPQYLTRRTQRAVWMNTNGKGPVHTTAPRSFSTPNSSCILFQKLKRPIPAPHPMDSLIIRVRVNAPFGQLCSTLQTPLGGGGV